MQNLVQIISLVKEVQFYYHSNPKYWDTLTPNHTCPKIWNSPFYYLLMCLKYCWMGGKQRRPWSDAAFCSIWSFSHVAQQKTNILSEYTTHLEWCFLTLSMLGKNFSRGVNILKYFFLFLPKIGHFSQIVSNGDKCVKYQFIFSERNMNLLFVELALSVLTV